MEKGKRLQNHGKIIRENTIVNYRHLLQHLEMFSRDSGKTLRIKDHDHLNTTRELRSEKRHWKNFYFEFTDYLYKNNCFDNYVGSIMKLLRSFFNYLKNELILNPGNYHNSFHISQEDIPVLALLPERLNFLIHNKEFENSLPKRLQKFKDMFVFGCTTAVRFSDLMNLKPANLETINGAVYLCVHSQKTNIHSRIYLPDYIQDILLKYNRRTTSLFPPISKTNYNKAIKDIALLAGWTEEIIKTRNVRGERIIIYKNDKKKENYRFCDLVSSHTMRRTAITTMLRCGMNEINVRLISGHNANSKSFYRYVNYTDRFMDEEMRKAYAELKKFS